PHVASGVISASPMRGTPDTSELGTSSAPVPASWGAW
ncbi:MAG: hypothetical protein JWQ60_4395, partial [Pseudonocardia sp.]|nr:hypothetical protein [Pseudonocardia sp.]